MVVEVLDADVGDEPDPVAFVVDVVVPRFGWIVELVELVALFELGPDDPQAASTSAPTAARTTEPANLPRRDTPYASTVRSASRSANRRCASDFRVGMCSVGTSCGEYALSTRRATVWRWTSSGPS